METRSNPLARISKKISVFHIFILFVIYVVFSLLAAGPGILHNEMYLRMPVHLSGKPLLQILFDAESMNFGGWEARQLSYLFDVIDGKFIALSIRLGIPHFRSITHYLFTLIMMLVLWSSFTQVMKLDRLLAFLLIALLLTTPSFIYSYYYRTSKIGVSLLMIILLSETYKVLKGNSRLDRRLKKPSSLLLIFLLATLALMMFDILGGLLAAVLAGYCLCALLLKPDKYKAAAVAGMTWGGVLWIIYFVYLGPAIMLAVTGQKANTDYLVQAPFQNMVGYLLLGIPTLMVDMVRYLFGYFDRALAVLILIWMIGTSFWLSSQRRKPPHSLQTLGEPGSKSPEPESGLNTAHKWNLSRFEPLLSLLFLLGGIAIVYDFLVTRHPAILWRDVRPSYYIMPAQAVLLFGFAALLARARIKWNLRHPRLYYLAVALFTVFLVGNITGSIRIKDVLFNGYTGKTYTQTNSPALLDALRHLDTPNYHPDDGIATDPIYLLFSQP